MNRLPISFESTADNVNGIQLKQFNINTKIVFISNDSGTYDMKVNFDKSTGEGGFTVKAGEAVSDIPMECKNVSIIGIGGAVAFRILGV